MKNLVVPLIWFCLALSVPPSAFAQQQAARGITEPFHDVTLSVTVPGRVSEILRKEGDRVQAGDEILALDRDLESLEVERRRIILDSTVELQEAKQKLATADQLLKSTRTLYASTHSVSQDELSQKELDASVAALEVQRLQDAEKQQKIELDLAQVQLSQRTVAAPFDGVIVKLFVDLGDQCNPQAPVARIVDNSRCRLIVQIDAASSRGLDKGTAVRISVPSTIAPAPTQGTVEYIAPVVDPSSGLREVKILFDNPDGRVLPGVTGSLVLPQRGSTN
ncbi:MAG TPA: efflux RND transporter periplasmic adaptor subunit [Spirochaetia bacterium]|nr:efflux RND transporter periplasmic adaptor subunit [Spirochaetia bacterium]